MKPIIEYLLGKRIKQKNLSSIENARQVFLNDNGKFESEIMKMRFDEIESRFDKENGKQFVKIILKLDEEGFESANCMYNDGTYKDKNGKYCKVEKTSKFFFLDSTTSYIPFLKVFNLQTNTYWEIIDGMSNLEIKKSEEKTNIYNQYFNYGLLKNKVFSSKENPFEDLDKILEEIVK